MTPLAPQPRALYLLLALIALAAAGKPILYDTLDPDCFWHLKVAEQIAREGPRPLVDPLSFASSKTPWTPYSWLAELGMKSLWDLGGFRAALLVHVIMNCAFVLLIATACARSVGYQPASKQSVVPAEHHRGLVAHPTAILPATLFATFLSLPYLSFRPATLAIVILAGVACMLERHRARPARAIWFIVPLTALLANIHLFAFLVPLWLGCRWLGAMLEARTRRTSSAGFSEGESSNARHHYAALFFVTAFASCATPLLPGVIQTVLQYQFADPMVASGKLAEMRPFYTGTLGIISAIVVIAFFALVVIRRTRLAATDILLLALSTALLLSKGRYAPLFAITAAPIFVRLCASAIRVTGVRESSVRETASDFESTFADSASSHVPAAPSHERPRSPFANPLLSPALTILLALGIVRLIAAFPSADLSAFLNRHGPDAPGYPTAAADYIAHHVPARSGRIVNDFTWGGYLEYRLGPSGFQTLMDGRTQCFSADFWKSFCLGPADATTHALSLLQADAALLPRADTRLKPALIALGWRWVYSDDRADVLLPPTAAHEARLRD